MQQHPVIIQGGMGAGVSSWRLAQAVSRLGQLGVVSGTALDEIFVRRLQDGDPGGHMRRGLDAFPFPAMAERIWRTFSSLVKSTKVSFLNAPWCRRTCRRGVASIVAMGISFPGRGD